MTELDIAISLIALATILLTVLLFNMAGKIKLPVKVLKSIIVVITVLCIIVNAIVVFGKGN